MRWSELVTGHPGRKPFKIAVGTAANRPTAGGYLLDALWFSTDVSGGTLYRCSLNTDGSGAYWQQIAGSVSGGSTITVVDAGGDTTCWPLLATAQTGSVSPATDADLTYDATNNLLYVGGGITSDGFVTVNDGATFTGSVTVGALNCDTDAVISGNVSAANLILNATLTVPADPNADRILFWDDSAGATAWLTAGSGLSISGTTITATATSEAAANAVLRANAFY